MDQREENWSDSPILDFAVFDDMVLRMEEVAVEIVQLFLIESPARMVILAKALEGGDLEGVLDVVHRFKSSSALLGGMRLSRLCEMLELRLRKERKLRGLEAELKAAQELLGPTLAAIELRWEKSVGTA
jgi:HPt (histidine-containing phosphotransfer) domain-containing protein